MAQMKGGIERLSIDTIIMFLCRFIIEILVNMVAFILHLSILVDKGSKKAFNLRSECPGSKVIKTRPAHQVPDCYVFLLMTEGYEGYCSTDSGQSTFSFEVSCQKRKCESQQFEFCSLALDMELTVFMRIRPFREGDFNL